MGNVICRSKVYLRHGPGKDILLNKSAQEASRLIADSVFEVPYATARIKWEEANTIYPMHETAMEILQLTKNE